MAWKNNLLKLICTSIHRSRRRPRARHWASWWIANTINSKYKREINMPLRKITWIKMAITSIWTLPKRQFWILISIKNLNIIEKIVLCPKGNRLWKPNYRLIKEILNSNFRCLTILDTYHQEWRAYLRIHIIRSTNLANVYQMRQSKRLQNGLRRLRKEACTTAKRSCRRRILQFPFTVTKLPPSSRTESSENMAIWAK